jgi:hypothetical protein
MKKYVWLLVFLLVAPLHIARGADLNGTWEWRGEGFTITLIMNPDGSGKLDEANIRYSVQGDRIIVNEDGDNIDYRFQLAGDNLTLSQGDLDAPTVFTRKNSVSTKGIGARKSSKDGAGTAQQSNSEIFGSWRGQSGDTLQLNTDRSILIQGVSYPYEVDSKTIRVKGPKGTLDLQYELNGDSLIVTLNGQSQEYQRQNGSAISHSSGMTAPSNTLGSSSPQNCNLVVVPANVIGGCQIRMVTPALCEEIDLSRGQSYEFAWTTDGTDCETPYTLVVSGSPATDMNSKSWQLPTNVEQGITRNGGITYISESDLSGLTTDNGLYNWVVVGYYGSHPESRAFKLKK